MKSKVWTFCVIILAVMITIPLSAQEKPTENIRKKGQKVINRQIDKSFNKLFGKEDCL